MGQNKITEKNLAGSVKRECPWRCCVTVGMKGDGCIRKGVSVSIKTQFLENYFVIVFVQGKKTK